MSSRLSNDAFPSLSSGIGADGGPGVRQFEASLERIGFGRAALQERAELDTHPVTYNSRFQFFHTKRTSIINDSPMNDLASREDSLVKAWRTVTEIDALLGSDFRPASGSASASAAASRVSREEEDRPSPLEEAYVKRLNVELEAAMNVSLTFKERYRAGRGGRAAGAGGWPGLTWGPPHGVAPSPTAASESGYSTRPEAQGGGAGGGGGADFQLSTSRGSVSGSPLPAPPSYTRRSDASGSGVASPTSQPLHQHPDHHRYHHLHHHYLHKPAPKSQEHQNQQPQQQQQEQQNLSYTVSSPQLSQRLASSNSGCDGLSVTPAAAAAVPAYASAPSSALGKVLPQSYTPTLSPAPPASPGPPPSPRSVQLHGAATSTSTSVGSVVMPVAAAAATPPLSPPPPSPLYRRLQAGGGAAIRVAVGSALDHGVWDSDGVWRPTEAVHEVYVPQNLQRISPDDLIKVRELGRGCFGSVWLARWRGVEVALKELHSHHATDGPPNEVFYEAERLAALRHPCVIAFYGIVTAPGCHATVVEYLRMGSLKSGLTRLRKQGADINRRLRAAIALQAARGMEYLHSQFLVHFDLKCDNLLCDLRDPARPVVKIGDLGLSKKKKDSFVSGNMRGTLPWMAPELFPGVREKQRQQEATALECSEMCNGVGGDGGGGGGGGGCMNGPATVATTARANGGSLDCWDDRVNEKVDVFSFGVVLWEIWQLGEQPYNSYSLADIFAGVMTGSLRPGVPPDCDPAWAELMQACWHANPRSRPSFSVVAERLEAIQERLANQEAAVAATVPVAVGAGGGGGAAATAFGSRRF